MKNIEFLFKDKKLEIYSKGEIFGNDIEAKAILKNKLTKPYHIENAYVYTKEMNLNQFTVKQLKEFAVESGMEKSELSGLKKSQIIKMLELKTRFVEYYFGTLKDNS